jgi:hypothetical protein
MGKLDLRLENIFAQARDIADANEQAAFVERACGGDGTLGQEVEALRQADQAAGDLMKAAQVAGPGNPNPAEKTSDRIGRYKLLEQIDAGGFGVVWGRAGGTCETPRGPQDYQAGHGHREVVTRFEAEP